MGFSLRQWRRSTIAAAVATGLALTACTVDDGAASAPAPAAAGLAVVPALHDQLPQAVRDAGLLRFAGDSHPPYRTVSPDGTTVTGIDHDFQQALGQILGVRVETTIVSGLPAALQGMLSGRYDAFNGPAKATAEREQQFDTVTWMTTRTSYVVPVGSTAGVKQADDLCGKRVAVVTGSVVEDQLAKLSAFCQREGRPAAQVIGLDDTNATLLAAKSGRAEAAGMTQAAAIDVTTQQKGQYEYVTQTEEQGATKDNLALYTPKSAGLGPVLQKAFEELFRDGTYARIMNQWGLNDVTVPRPLFDVASAG
ncbi:polar amino acid transport system substrate-binding protein [Amycolatopsis bartoniae]|uniref:Amino acid ABC transporter n=1 Tax=Amycolatopsis bartoniae TaxID=941986 RepID=A0A8H9MEB3_9PSEU|nr:transporter substrate-binding domain-containing protein [Amycolatopsis bartoniae]MBB2938439.1 polar amino acid transport system substrate-binding protein [Amycolatopsis bartoniae]TVT10406.1 transporter substrate-binding domain-containing protein [Amycolatopsis bartoniae]GHF70989.1 amino acid ABC transporter [Amycolatopsis bartoniae]